MIHFPGWNFVPGRKFRTSTETHRKGDLGIGHLPLAVLAMATASALAAPNTDLPQLSEWLQPRQAPVPPSAVVVSELHWGRD